MMTYDPKDWYWIVGGDATQVFASARGIFVPVADATFQAWGSDGSVPTRIDTAANLGAVLAAARVRPVDASILAGYQQAAASGLDLAMLKVLFNHESRLRVLEAKQPITQQQFVAAIAALL